MLSDPFSAFPPVGQVGGLFAKLMQGLLSIDLRNNKETRDAMGESFCKREDLASNALGDIAGFMERFPEGQALLSRDAANMKLNPTAYMRATPPNLR